MGFLDAKPMSNYENAWYIYDKLHIVSKTTKMTGADFFRLPDKEKWKKVRRLVKQSSAILYPLIKLEVKNEN